MDIINSGSEESGGEDVQPVDVSENKRASSDESEDDMDVESNKIYLPGGDCSDGDDGELECDESAYVLYHQAQTGSPCLSFDIIRDNLEDNRADQFPLTAYLAAGTQGDRPHVNNILVMKLSNMNKVKAKKEENEDEEEESESEDEDEKPELDCALVPHPGCVNRIKVTYLAGNAVAASWSERGKVHLWDLSHPLRAVNNPHLMTTYVRNSESPKPLFTFNGHQIEGYALDWSSLKPGVLASGDCNKNIHLWKPVEGGTWHVDQRPYAAHTASVEDLQWSPNEANVLASCSVDKSIRIWDTRASPQNACMLTTESAHDSDVNVISWNHREPFILSGGDDGIIKIWDLRQFQKKKPIAVFKHHTAPITSVEWHPTDTSVYAASGADDQITLWDLSVEKDTEQQSDLTTEDPALDNLPPQLLFIHQGQKDIKELHWHPQMPGVVISTAHSGFNVFRTISV